MSRTERHLNVAVGATADSTPTVNATWAWGMDPEPVRMERGSDESFYHANRMGSVEKLTDDVATVVESVEYTAHGKPSIGSSGAGNLFFWGAELHAVSVNLLAGPCPRDTDLMLRPIVAVRGREYATARGLVLVRGASDDLPFNPDTAVPCLPHPECLGSGWGGGETPEPVETCDECISRCKQEWTRTHFSHGLPADEDHGDWGRGAGSLMALAMRHVACRWQCREPPAGEATPREGPFERTTSGHDLVLPHGGL